MDAEPLEQQRVSFESLEADRMEFASARLDGVVWLPEAGTQASVALTNVASQTITVVASAAGAAKTKPASITLDPRETDVVNLRELVAGCPTAALVTLEHNGFHGC